MAFFPKIFLTIQLCTVKKHRQIKEWKASRKGKPHLPRFLADQLTLSQPGGWGHIIPTHYYKPLGFSNLATALNGISFQNFFKTHTEIFFVPAVDETQVYAKTVAIFLR